MVATHKTTIHEPPGVPTAEAKWAAAVGDRLVALPRRLLKARDIVAQAAGSRGTLVRDYNQLVDVALAPDTVVDLAEGNVFRIVGDCANGVTSVPPGSQPKFAFVADDSWEVTIQAAQTLESLRGLFDLPDDAELFRDFESPNDVPILPGTPVQFADGPVFRVQISSITVIVNRKDVRFTHRRVNGLEVKQTAKAQGVDIQLDFNLYRKKPDGGFGPVIDNEQELHLRKCDEFRCLAPDDNS